MTRRLLAVETIVGLALLSRRVRSILCGVGDAVDEPSEAVAERGSGIIRRSYRVLVVTHAKTLRRPSRSRKRGNHRVSALFRDGRVGARVRYASARRA